ncbi:tRNA (N6-isopentenyl adenosine(37)-C2)-methylthiotransferase MiaB [Tichowtungia aerotolerans]|uniref:tRNA-2-methylthio-N(6)-dimethylallyladenosine synthase n=1 Tax=Tichowtungia aerotolerans TaxID=2697043 RepID=A0A6P1M6J4_9BACT|nr:tRNA (N6-isopentenyl adenosine(37)-C2)-methylthiotransferase MiaB [Tichowtungia aerotolerans]QHI70419.1 tRNA (N6-isopentenyl adenosine(37)-C2)-methylthiotransferase MiaB [Tichowtungia aerotolerans]
MTGTYHIWTIGCQMNEADSRHLASQFEALGFVETPKAVDADIAVLNTCVVRQQPEDKAVRKLTALGGVKKNRPGMIIALMGCMVGTREAEDLAERFPFVDVFAAPSQTDMLVDTILQNDAYQHLSKAQIELADYRLPAVNRDKAVTAFVPVTLGCSHVCSYCVIPHRRGPDRSRKPDEVLSEVRALAEQGIKEVNLLGQIVDRYGFDLEEGINLAWLLREVAEIDGILRVRFLTSHPAYMDEELIRTVAETEKVCPYIEIPFQAGSDRILESMRRGYTQQEYRDIVSNIRKYMPEAAINTDVIVGYPTETEEDFQETMKLAEDLRLDMHHIAKYSPRPRTLSSRMEDDVSPDEKESRRVRLDDLVTKINAEKSAELLGQTVEVLVEEFQEKKNRWRGRTPHNKLVFFESKEDCLGQLVNVKINWTGPFSLIGTIA